MIQNLWPLSTVGLDAFQSSLYARDKVIHNNSKLSPTTDSATSRGFWCSMRWEEVLDPGWVRCCWRGCRWTTGRSRSWGSPSTRPLRYRWWLLSCTIACCQLIACWNTWMWRCCWTTRRFMTSAGDRWTSSV